MSLNGTARGYDTNPSALGLTVLEESESLGQMLTRNLLHAYQPYAPQADVHKKTGEVALMYATLQDAIRCFQRYYLKPGRRAQRLYKEVDDWFHADDYTWPFSFVNICAVLDLDPGYLRMGLRLWQERSARGHIAPWPAARGLSPANGSANGHGLDKRGESRAA